MLEQSLNPHQYRVIMSSDLNVPNYDWVNGVPLPNSHYYNKMKRNSIQTATCFLGHDQRNGCRK
jgi:hypothetical protein